MLGIQSTLNRCDDEGRIDLTDYPCATRNLYEPSRTADTPNVVSEIARLIIKGIVADVYT